MDASRPILWPKFTRFRGDTKRLRFTLTDDLGAVVQPDDCTLFFNLDDTDGRPLIQKQSTIGGFTTIVNAQGIVDVELVPADDALLANNIAYNCVVVAQNDSTGDVSRSRATLKLQDGILDDPAITLPTTVVAPAPEFLSAAAIAANRAQSDADAAAALASKNAAATSETNAADSAAAALASKNAAATSETNAGNSAAAALASKNAAATSETNAGNSAAAALASKNAAATSETNAGNSAAAALASKNAATTSETNAGNSAGAAAGSAVTAATQAGLAATAKTNADSAAALAASYVVQFSAPQLAKWFKNNVTGKTLCLVGDSTTWQIDGVTTAAVATVSGGAVASIGSITNPTGGYSRSSGVWATAPRVVVTGDGTGATAHAVLTGASVTSIVVDTGGSGYTYADVNFVSLAFAEYQTPNQPLAGVTVLNFGNNGQTLQGFLTDAGHFGLAHTLAVKADLYVIDYGINDVRQGARTQNQIATDLTTAVTSIRAGAPNSCIVLRMPNTFLTTDVGSHGYISPNSSAQAYSDILAAVYRSLAFTWPDVVLYDSHQGVWTDTCPATSTIMTDQLHPLRYGYDMAQIAALAAGGMASGQYSALGYAPVVFPKTGNLYQSGQTAIARGVSTSVPYNTYFRAAEDTDNYVPVLSGTINATGSGFIDINIASAFTGSASAQYGDILAQEGQQPFAITAASATHTFGIFRIAMTAPYTLTAGNKVTIYRQPWLGDSNIQSYWQNTAAYPLRIPINSVIFAGNGNLWISLPANAATQITTADTVVMVGRSPVVLSGATFSTSGHDGSGYLMIAKSGTDFTGWTGQGYVFGAARAPLIPSGSVTAPVVGQIYQSGNRTVAFEGSGGAGGTYAANTVQTSGYAPNGVGYVRVAADVANNTTTLANVTGLTATLAASTSYSFEAALMFTADATGGHQYAIGGTATATDIRYHIDSVSDASGLAVITATETALAAAAGQAGSVAGLTMIRGSITVNAAGTLTVQFAQNAGPNNSSTVKRGSFFKIWQD